MIFYVIMSGLSSYIWLDNIRSYVCFYCCFGATPSNAKGLLEGPYRMSGNQMQTIRVQIKLPICNTITLAPVLLVFAYSSLSFLLLSILVFCTYCYNEQERTDISLWIWSYFSLNIYLCIILFLPPVNMSILFFIVTMLIFIPSTCIQGFPFCLQIVDNNYNSYKVTSHFGLI